MGLDVSAYKGLAKLDCRFNEDSEPVDEQGNYIEAKRIFSNPDFPGRTEGLEDRAAYKYLDYMEGWSGGYGRYNGWREWLAEIAGYPDEPFTKWGHTELRHDAGAWKATSGPFWELICFSDCEGDIGPIVSKKLAEDFAKFDAIAKEKADDDYYEKYRQWREVFEFASDNGVVAFH